MKLGKTSWLILVAGVFIVIVGTLALTRSQQLKEQGRLDEELILAEKRLEKLEVDQLQRQHDKLQEQLDESQAQLVSVKDKLSQTVESIDVTDEFFAIAQSCSVIIESISSSTIQSESLNGIACSKTSLNAVATGKASNLISFIIKLNSDFTTGAVKLAQISIKESDGDSKSSADVQMVVYTYEGD